MIRRAFAVAVALALPVLSRAGTEDAWIEKGNEARQQGDFEVAIACFAKAIQINPRSVPAHVRCGEALIDARPPRRDPERALATLNAAVRLGPEEPEAYSGRAHVHAELGDPSRALSDLNRAIWLDPGNSGHYVDRGFAYLALGDFHCAPLDFDEALRLNPAEVKALQGRAVFHWGSGHYDDAIADLSEAISYLLRAGGEAAVLASAFYCLRGEVYYEKKEWRRALSDYLEALKLHPKLRGALRSLAWVHAACPDAALRNGGKALGYARMACDLRGWKEPKDLEALAAAYAELAKFPEAIEWQQKALELLAGSADARKEAEKRLELYKQGKPWREAEPTSP